MQIDGWRWEFAETQGSEAAFQSSLVARSANTITRLKDCQLAIFHPHSFAKVKERASDVGLSSS
jgi:hypothetical protein